jgi:GNAT superfamily N-acetyltransferase
MEKLIINQHPVGILAYHDDQPIGWCSVAPRHEFAVLDRSPTLKPVDDKPVWSIVCFFVSKPYRQQGVCGQLIEAALVYARSNGARIVEAYPLIPENTVEPRYERYSGVITTFLKAGFVEIARRSARKPIMRYYFNP